jgi:hypothetical protein
VRRLRRTWEIVLAWSDPPGVERLARMVLRPRDGAGSWLDAVREAAERAGVDVDRLEGVEVNRGDYEAVEDAEP